MSMVRSTIAAGSTARAFLTVVRLTTFERSARGLLSEEAHASLDELLATHPNVGPVIRRTGGVRKLRIPIAGRGKRGGVRIIYYYHGAKQRVYLILAYAKGTKDSLSSHETQQMRKLTAVLEREP